MRCIYCLKPSNRSTHRAHVFPEALAPNGPVLPLGAECDKCNEYAGSKLESILVRHPLIAIPIQLGGLPGKSGKQRDRLGVFDRRARPDAAITFPIEAPKFHSGPDGIRRATVTATVDPHLDYAKFSRALHHMAFNVFAFKCGVDAALADEFDAVRRFVKAPVDGKQRWSYVEICRQLERLVPECGADLKEVTGARMVLLRVYNVDYLVDLVNSGLLLTARIGGPALRAQVVGPDWVPPVPKPLEAAPGGMVRHYQISIV